ncbi:class I SAM-dependent methyltransferase [Streptococcus moroccensis]|uniref:Site-specific DNA-methyltransferase (Adenine-specific) n=1 Tax=Streptococcus moroccensis TaxID=1451356 RepID=A0ABT9YTL6_9STRE|nr:class I SAM-dependent methyltransferase [Streptococcus moroccensis]MDQ0222936.1 site-specific DNA-methyltransferase (adenine-specific) [Streptococcus moroccensis]
MNFEKIEAAYELLLENVQLMQNQLMTNAYDALIEQNLAYLNETVQDGTIQKNNEALKALTLSKEEWRRAYQFLLIKLNQAEPLQYNHQFTPDSIGFLIAFVIETLTVEDRLEILEIGSGIGNLANTLLNNTQKDLDYLGIELDDLLIDLSASMAEVMGADVHFVQGDAIRPQLLKPSDIILSDLPVGYYPDDSIASRFSVASKKEHTYAHHLLMAQSIKYLKADGYAIFLAPNNLLTSAQSDLLKVWLKEEAQLVVMINLPETLFGKKEMAKSLFVFQKPKVEFQETFVYPLQSLQDPETLQNFSQVFKKWVLEYAN